MGKKKKKRIVSFDNKDIKKFMDIKFLVFDRLSKEMLQENYSKSYICGFNRTCTFSISFNSITHTEREQSLGFWFLFQNRKWNEQKVCYAWAIGQNYKYWQINYLKKSNIMHPCQHYLRTTKLNYSCINFHRPNYNLMHIIT